VDLVSWSLAHPKEFTMSKRKQFTPEQKVAMVRRHLVENVPVSDLCDELGIHATQYYNWQKQFFENGQGAFARRPNCIGSA
jgi:transposase-like protein